MADDISKKTVAVLLVISIVLSVTGTWLALNAEPKVTYVDNTGSGHVKVKINEPDPEPVSRPGNVGVTILPDN